MTNIFENAYFGKSYKTRNGRKAIFYKGVFTRARKESNYVTLLLEEDNDLIQGFHTYKLDGTAHDGHTYLDIISECQEKISDEELDRLALEYCNKQWATNYKSLDEITDDLDLQAICDFKAGYREALNKKKKMI